MKKLLCLCICLMLTGLLAAAGAETASLPTINEALLTGKGGTEVCDDLSAYDPLSDTIPVIDKDFRLIILQREMPLKEFTAKTDYPPFENEDGFDDDFVGVDIGSPRVWLRNDLMERLPEQFRASSLEDATYLIIAENLYVWDGTVSTCDYKENENLDLPEFSSADEMAAYFAEHPKTVESITYYPKFCAFTLVSLYETETKRCSNFDYTVTSAMRFARNPDAGTKREEMSVTAGILDALDEGMITDAKKAIEEAGFVSQGQKDRWTSSIDAGDYAAASSSLTEYYWAMATDLRDLDPSSENRENYNLIITAQNRQALDLFADYCDYYGFDRSISSIEESGDYIAAPDYDWMVGALDEAVKLFIR